MDKKKLSATKKIAALLSVAVCVWATADKISKADGTALLMQVVGVEAASQENEEIPKQQEVVQQQTDEPEGTAIPFLDADSIAPFIQDELPQLTETPDPNRNSNRVEEINVTDGMQVDNFRVKDTTGSGTDLAQELLNDPLVKLKCNSEIEVLIYHTHTTESYMDSFSGFYYTDMETRTQNQEASVVAVGKEIKQELEKAGIGVIHDTEINDAMYSGSYARSWEVLQRNLSEHPSIQVTIDVHRDSMTTAEGVKYKPTALVDGRKAAQVMILAGCDANGGWGDFPNWRENLRFALRVQQKASEMYPEMMRPLNFGNNKYNMNATTGSILVEVGTEVNTVSEASYSGQLVGEVLAELLSKDLHGG